MRKDKEIMQDIAMKTINQQDKLVFNRKEKAFMEVLLDIRRLLGDKK